MIRVSGCSVGVEGRGHYRIVVDLFPALAPMFLYKVSE
jgi:hypothetical protein